MPNEIWDKIFTTKEWGKYPSENLIKFISKKFDHSDRKQKKILEIGCGPGANIWYLSREGFDTYGIDASKVAINRAQERIKKNQLRASLQVGDISKLPYEKEFFSAVVDCACLYNNDREKTKIILEEVKRVLKPEGLFYSQTFSEDTYKGQTFKKLKELEFKDSSDGPFFGSGFFRLANKRSIEELYSGLFNIKSISRAQQTNDQDIKISHMIIVAEKK